MKPKNPVMPLCVAITLALGANLPAATVSKSATGTDLADGASWGVAAPAATDTATWADTSLGTGLTLGTSANWQGIAISGATSAVDISGSGTITLGTGGVNMGGSAVDATIGNPIVLAENQTWQAATGRTLTASGNISGAGDLTFGNLAEGQTTTTFLTTTAQTLFTNASLARLVSTSGKMGGAWVNNKVPLPGNGYVLNNNGTTATYWLEVIEGTYTKGVKIELAQSGADITARALSAKYITSLNLGYDFNAGGTAGTVATSQGAGGYGAYTTTLKFGYDATGTIVLSGTNTYTGATRIAAGTLRVSGGAAIPDTSSVTLESGTFDLWDNETIGSLGGTGGTVALNSNTLTTGADDGTSSYPGVFTGASGSLVKTGTGDLTLASNTGGGTGVAAVVVENGSLVLDGAAVAFGVGYFTGTTAYTVKTGASLHVNRDWNIVPGNTITVDGGTLAYGAMANYTNDLTLENGATVEGGWRVGHNSGSAVAGRLVSTGDTANNVTGTVNLVKFPSVASHVWTVDVADGAAAEDLKIAGNIVDMPGLPAQYIGTSVRKTGAGTISLEGLNAYRGGTEVADGTLVLPQTGQMTFYVTNTGSNQLTGAGSAVINGDFIFDISAVTANTGTWIIEDVATLTGPYGPDFRVVSSGGTPWTGEQGDKWSLESGIRKFVFDETTGTLTVEPLGFSAWAAANAPGQTIGEDHDNDGVTNGIEYFMGETGDGFTRGATVVNGTLTWPKGAGYGGTYGTDYTVQTSPDLVNWTDVAADDPALNAGGAGALAYTLPGGRQRLFCRLRVTGP